MYKTLIHNKKAVLFDLDGTIVKSNSMWKQAFDKVAGNFNFFVTANFPAGLPIEEKWERQLKLETDRKNATVSELTKQTISEFVRLMTETTPEVIDGFWQLAKELKVDRKMKLGLTTNSQKDVVNAMSTVIGFKNVFDIVLTADDVKTPKPNPEIYRKALKTLRMRAKDVLVFEDSIAGVTAAVDAGIDTCVIWDGSIPKSHYPNTVKGFLEDFTTIPGNMDKTKTEYYKELGNNILKWWDKHKLSEKFEAASKSQ